LIYYLPFTPEGNGIGTMKFIADGMLGRLTRWLRLLGYDVGYLHDTSDDELLAVAKKEKRILLTCDLVLCRKARKLGITPFLIRQEDEAEKLANLAKEFNIRLEVDEAVSRCSKCNCPIRNVEKSSVVGRLHSNTLDAYEEYWECTGCGKIYWHGSHWKKIDETLEEAKVILRRKNLA